MKHALPAVVALAALAIAASASAAGYSMKGVDAQTKAEICSGIADTISVMYRMPDPDVAMNQIRRGFRPGTPDGDMVRYILAGLGANHTPYGAHLLAEKRCKEFIERHGG